MTKETADQLIQFLAAMAHHSREHALKLKALELIAKKHPEIFQDYEKHLLCEALRVLLRCDQEFHAFLDSYEFRSILTLRYHEPMKYIAQRDAHGCLIAAVAMVLDLDYDEVGRFVHPA